MNNNDNIIIDIIHNLKEIISSGNELEAFKEAGLDLNIINNTFNDLQYEGIYEIIKAATVLGLCDGQNDGSLVKQIYTQFICESKNSLKGKEIFKLYQNSNKISNDIDRFNKKQNLLKDKKRFLQGDFDKEKHIENEKLKFNSIQNGIEFEKYLKYVFEKLGYVVEMTKTTGDQGADLIITKDNVKTVVQAKFYSNTVGNKAVQEVVSAIKYYKADNGLVVTNNSFTKSAIELAEVNGITLWNGEKLRQVVETLMK